MKIRLLIPLFLLLVLGGGGWWVERSRKEQRSLLSGYFESQPTLVASRTAGRVRRIVATEGTSVKAGDLLLELDSGPGQADTRALQERAREARARYQELKAGSRWEDIRRQEAVVAEMRAQWERARNGSREAEVGAARARYEQSRANYAKAVRGPRAEDVARLRAALDEARARASFARNDLKRLDNLYANGALSLQSYERAQTDAKTAAAAARQAEQNYLEAQRGNRHEDVEAARAEAEAARQQLLLLQEGSRREDIDIARARYEQAEAQLTALRNGNRPEVLAQARAAAESAESSARSAAEKVEERRVTAPLAGTVERVQVAVGDLVQADTPLVRMSDPSDLWLRVYLPEDQLPKVKVGDPADIRVDGLSASLAGHVDTIATQGEFTPANLQTPGDRGKQVFSVRLRLDKPDLSIKAGMSATVKSVGKWEGTR